MTAKTSPRERDWKRNDWPAIALLTALAALLRLATVTLQSYDFDEGWTVEIVHGSTSHLAHGIANVESTPPLYYLLAWLWAHAFGTGEGALRSLSALAGIATIPVVYAAGRTLASTRVALTAALLAATSPYLVFYSQEARAYSLFALLATVAFLCCLRAIREPTPGAFGLWALAAATSIAVHYFAVFAVAGQAVALALFTSRRRALATALAGIGIAGAPLALLAHHQAAGGRTDWIGASSLPQRVRVTVETFALGATFKGSLSHALLAVFAGFALLLGAGLAIAAFLLLRRAEPTERRTAAVAAVVAAVGVVIPLVAALGPADYFLGKNIIFVVPLLAILVATGLGGRHSGTLGLAGLAAAVAAGLALTVLSFAAPSLRRADVRQAANQLGPARRDRAIVFVPRWQLLLQEYVKTPLAPLPARGARLSEVDVFTTDRSLPAGTVPPGFQLTRKQHGTTFTVFTFRSRRPLLIVPGHIAKHVFAESGLQPIALLQSAQEPRGRAG